MCPLLHTYSDCEERLRRSSEMAIMIYRFSEGKTLCSWRKLKFKTILSKAVLQKIGSRVDQKVRHINVSENYSLL